MNFKILPEAELELTNSMTYYESREPRLGLEFAEEVYTTIQNIMENPNTWPVLKGRVRRATTRRFPYSVFYTPEADHVLIVAITHFRRKPNFWQDRLP